MDFGSAFVSSIIAGGKDAYKLTVDRGIKPEYLEGQGREAMEFLVGYVQKHAEIPSRDIILGKTGIDVGLPEGAPSFFIEECLNLRLFKLLKEGLVPATKLLSDNQPRESLEAIQKLVREIGSEQLVARPSESIFKLAPTVLELYDRMKKGERGIPLPFPSLNDATLGVWPQDLVLFVARLGQGKCVHEDSLIIDPVTGVPHKISEVYSDKNLKRITTWGSGKGVHGVEISNKIDTGRKDCLKFTLNSGRSIIVTPEHPFMTPDGWKKAEEVSIGHSLAIPAVMPEPESPTLMPEEDVDLLALLLSEGSYTSESVGFSTADPLILEIARNAASKKGVTVNYRSKYDYAFCKIEDKHNPWIKNPVRLLLDAVGISHEKAINKSIPNCIFKLSNKQLSRFLSIFWMCDGYVSPYPEMCLSSKKMLDQIQSLLLRFGIQSRMSYKKSTCNGKKFDSWRLLVISESYTKFKENIQLWGYKLENLEVIESKDRNPNVGFPVVSESLQNKIKIQFDSISEDMKHPIRDEFGWSNNVLFRDICQDSTLRLTKFRRIHEMTGVFTGHEQLLDPELFWDHVISIESLPDQKIYDLTVAPTSCFIANDILVHNTWSLILCANSAWSAGYKVLLCTTEMSKQAIAQRTYATQLKLPYKDFKRGTLNIFIEDKMRSSLAELMAKDEDRFHVIGGEFNFNPSTLQAEIDNYKPDIVIFDGAYLMQTEGASRNEKAANAFNELKRIANTTRIPFIVSSQFNRDVKKNSPNSVQAESIGLTDVAGWNADVIFGLIQTEDMKEMKTMRYKPLKVREGEGQEFDCVWDIGQMKFEEINKDGTIIKTDDPFAAAAPQAAPDPDSATLF
jgi:replicative DNA helicase